jgi:histidine triad (HIT) family protein
MDCLFCAINAGDIPATKLIETDMALAFNDINPQAPVHILIIPKAHYENVAELSANKPDSLVELFNLAHQLAQQNSLLGYRTVFNTGAEAGQSVFHAHLHLLGGRALQWPPG